MEGKGKKGKMDSERKRSEKGGRRLNVFVSGVTHVHRELMAFQKSEMSSRFQLQLEFKGDDASRLLLKIPSAVFCDSSDTDAYAIYEGLEEHARRFQRGLHHMQCTLHRR